MQWPHSGPLWVQTRLEDTAVLTMVMVPRMFLAVVDYGKVSARVTML